MRITIAILSSLNYQPTTKHTLSLSDSHWHEENVVAAYAPPLATV